MWGRNERGRRRARGDGDYKHGSTLGKGGFGRGAHCTLGDVVEEAGDGLEEQRGGEVVVQPAAWSSSMARIWSDSDESVLVVEVVDEGEAGEHQEEVREARWPRDR